MHLTDTEIRRLYAHLPTVGRPRIRTNSVTTLDGAACAEDGLSGALGGEIDTRVFEILRFLSDVILVGAGTARSEGYGPAPRPIAVVSRSLDIPERLINSGQVVITTADAPADKVARLRETLDVIAVGEGRIDWLAVLDQFSRWGWQHVLCEGGPSLQSELVAHDLVDEMCVTIAPVLASGPAPRIVHGSAAVDRPMQLAHAVEADGALLTRWMRNRT